MASFVEFAIVRQIGLRYNANDAPAMDHDRGVKELTLVAYRAPYDQNWIEL